MQLRDGVRLPKGVAGGRRKFTTLVDLCRARSAAEPDLRTYSFYADGRTEWDALTLADLDRRARALATRLGELAPRGTRALLCFEPGLDFHIAFLGCLYAGLIAVPVAPLDGTRTSLKVSRISSIVESCGPELLLSTGLTFAKCLALVEESPALSGLVRVAVDETDPALADRWTPPGIGINTPAYLQYSSGSTGEPKGVTLTHGNVLHNLALIHDNLYRPSDEEGLLRPPSVSWLPSHYNMGLIGGVLDPLYAGRPAVLFPAGIFVRSPVSWLRLISQLGRADSCAPNFALDLCVRRVSEAQRARLDLSGWEMALIGGEPVRAGTLERFLEVFVPVGLRRGTLVPGYGLAESTVMVTSALVGEGPVILRCDADALTRGRALPVDPPGGRRLVSCGPVPPSVTLVIADPGTLQECAEGEVGEIFVQGPSVGTGYWNRPDEVFHAELPGRRGTFLRTGDTGFRWDGELFVTGRAKEVIIVAGANHHPHDLEATAETSHPAVLACCVLGVEDGQREQVVVLAEVVGDVDVNEIATAVRRTVHTGHGVRVDDVVLLAPGTLPRSSSGKLLRGGCRAAYAAGVRGPA
ncbi:fatty acyl-AMP ligase [Lentzea aerocolonigenes]|uniref:fatty acyl-AMP ligase n=1 Tax=Lentzea aerocolonigenes TaxID=68170 RepID=UPI000A8A8D4A|nr:fatty acyl-AMP ligase [Lentzea aerocolonigenes]MCP2247288.1 Acyl-CoA synthetase (AMP-forming)/AMP-acid ligase II [Lentzea aerocolonigenes]